MSGFDPNIARALRPPSRAPWVLLVLGLGAAGAGSVWMYQDRQKAKTEAADATAKIAAAEAGKKDLGAKIEKLEAEKVELEAGKEELSKEVAAKTGEIAELKGTYDKLEEKMKTEIANGDIRLTQSGGHLRVDLVDKILFDSGEAAISKRGEEVLSRVGAVLAAIDDKQIQVSGHTDKTPISEKLAEHFPTNWELSAARAINVVRFLDEKAGVPAARMIASGYGEHHPIASNKTAAGRARNRRIEILLTPSLDPKAIARSKLKAARAAATATDEKPDEKDNGKAAGAEKTAVAMKDKAKEHDRSGPHATSKTSSKPSSKAGKKER
jgi:chemotaxis protein MotB